MKKECSVSAVDSIMVFFRDLTFRKGLALWGCRKLEKHLKSKKQSSKEKMVYANCRVLTLHIFYSCSFFFLQLTDLKEASCSMTSFHPRGLQAVHARKFKSKRPRSNSDSFQEEDLRQGFQWVSEQLMLIKKNLMCACLGRLALTSRALTEHTHSDNAA